MLRLWRSFGSPARFCKGASPLICSRPSAGSARKTLCHTNAAAESSKVRLDPFTASTEKLQVTNVKFKSVAPFALVPRVIIYDGVCHLCNAGVRWVIKVDKEELINFCSVQSKAAEPYLIACGVSREDVLKRFIFVEGPGLCHSGSTAALKVASYLPFPYSTLSTFLIVPAPIRDAVYDYVANNRYKWFGRADECIIPPEESLHRFIDKEELLELKERAEEESTG